MPDLPFHRLASEQDLAEALARSEQSPVVLYKHSTTCPTSAHAQRKLARLTADDDPPVFQLVVQKARALSNEIAARFGIRHESPQAIVLHGSTPVAHMSHSRISDEAIREAAANVMLS